ncbi:glycosyltransferase [Acinetobacter baumannii]|uniref:glycosyltransferase n=1 Tax=Acinetobacter baumannii TaxID=470 RepID=UPI0010580256|nr:glycosyltransferase [Acinetobacter baumannii]MDC5481203.1 glycosyltransferase [Acinetobacter baumannii]QBM34827.1 glycosyltransferase [Acinetobacter baumannii]QBM43625.1 glycosyltransferase [Acinetobacter baumannii]
MRKKVLHVITNFSALGGAEMMLQKLILAQPEYDHYLISLISLSDIYEESLKQVKLSKALNWKITNTAKIISRLAKEIDTIQPDVIQSWMYHANFMVTIANSFCRQSYPIYWGIHHSLNSISEESLSTKVAIYLNKYLSKKATGIVYCAQSSLKQHTQFGFKNKNQVFIPNGIDLEKFRFVERDFNNPITIGFVGRNHKAKGIPYLFEVMSAFKDDPRIEFRVAGKGLSLKDKEIEDLSKKFVIGANVTLLDAVKKMEAFYHGIDVLLMTSITEGFPNVLIEAMATGAICISTDVGDARYIINDNGNIAEVLSTSDLINCINNYLKLSVVEKKQRMNEAFNLTINRFNIKIVTNKYKSFWNIK